MDAKSSKLELKLPSGKTLTSDHVRFDPDEPDDWPVAAIYAEALRRLASDELAAIILRSEPGHLDIDVDGCLAVLERCRHRGITPDANTTERLHLKLLEVLDGAAATGHFRNAMPN